MMIVKIHKTLDGRKVVAICDEEILGKRFEEGNLQLDLSSDFYKGDVVSEDGLLEILKDAGIVNVAGKKSVKFVEGIGILDKSSVIFIANVPHAQIILN